MFASFAPARRGLVAGGSLIPCRGDWWWACRVGGAVPWGLVGGRCVAGAVSSGLERRPSCVWRCVIVLGT